MASILILYHSQQVGNTHAMAEAIADGARAGGAEVQLVNTNEQRLDIDAYRKFDVVAFGTPDYYSYLAGGLKVFLDDWYIAKQADPAGLTDKSYGLFFSHGGGGGVRAPLEKLFGMMGTKIGETAESVGKPGEAELAACKLLGEQLAKAAS